MFGRFRCENISGAQRVRVGIFFAKRQTILLVMITMLLQVLIFLENSVNSIFFF